MEQYKELAYRILMWLLNVANKICSIFGIDIMPLTVRKVLEGLTPEQRREVLKPDFTQGMEYFLIAKGLVQRKLPYLRYMSILEIRYN